MTTILIVAYIVGYVRTLPIIYRAAWRDIRPKDSVDQVGIGLIAIIFSISWPVLALAFSFRYFLAPKEQS